MKVAAAVIILALLLFSFQNSTNGGLWLDLLASDGLSWWMGERDHGLKMVMVNGVGLHGLERE